MIGQKKREQTTPSMIPEGTFDFLEFDIQKSIDMISK